MRRVKHFEILGFLSARAALPRPETHRQGYCYIWVGQDPPPIPVYRYIKTNYPNRLHIFHRKQAAGRNIGAQWICMERHFQEMIYENRYQAMKLLENLLHEN